jgi:translocation and assembly module TamB
VLAQGRQRLELAGQVAPGGRVRASLDLKDFEPAPWLPERGLPQTTRLELGAELTGTLVEPVMRLRGRLHGLAWRRVGEGLVSFDGRLGGGELSLAGRVIWAEQPVLDLNATLGLAASLNPPNLGLTAEGLNARLTGKDLPLRLLAPTLRGVRVLGGRLDLDLRAQGDPTDPRLDGSMELSGGHMVIVPTGQRISDINLAFTARGREIVLTRGEADSGGHLSLRGRMLLPWKDAGLVELKAQGKDLLVGLGALGQVITDLDLDLDGAPAAPKARALLHPRQAVIHPKVAPPAALGDVVLLRPGQTPPPLDTEVHDAPRIFFPEPFHNLALEARVDLGSGIRVVVDEGWVNLLGAVRVTKAPGGPLVFWDSYRTDNGVIMVESRRFVVTGGDFIFEGRDRPDPALNVDVQYRGGGTQIFIILQGTAFEPQLQLSSEPPMSQADILSVIIFGRPAAGLNAGETRQLSAQALALVGQGSRREIEKILGPALSPDVFTVHSEVSTGSALEAGKYLSTDLYLRYRQNLSGEGGQNVGLEYRLNDWLSLESQVGTTRDSGVDAILNWDFN